MLEDPEEILTAKALLQKTYVEEGGWMPRAGNPSGLRVTEEHGQKVLTDRYDAVATWFGVFDGDLLVGCHRLCGSLDGKFEVELYHPLPRFLRERGKIAEFTRLTTRPGYRVRSRSPALFVLFRFEIEYAWSSCYDLIFGTAVFPSPGNLYLKLGWERCEERFRYDPRDGDEVTLVCGEYGNRSKVEAALERCRRLIDRLSRPVQRD